MKFFRRACTLGWIAGLLLACVFSTDQPLRKDELIGRWQSETQGPHGFYFYEYEFVNKDSVAFTNNAIVTTFDSSSIPVAFRYFSKIVYGSWEVAGNSLYLKRGALTAGPQFAVDTLIHIVPNIQATFKIKMLVGAIEMFEYDGTSRIYFRRK